MSNNAQYKIVPSEIDEASNIETLPEYVFTCAEDTKLEQTVPVADSATATLKYLGTCYMYELQSDYAVTLTIQGLVFTGVRNLIVKLDTRLTVGSAPTARNLSGYAATITWRMWDLSA